jgi:hypothetical protein
VADPFKELSQAIEALEKAEKHLKRVAANKCDWDNQDERYEYVRDHKRRARRARLEALVPGLVCPVCGETKTKSRSWVVFPRAKVMGHAQAHKFPVREEAACCRGCVFAHFKKELWSG